MEVIKYFLDYFFIISFLKFIRIFLIIIEIQNIINDRMNLKFF